MDILLTLLFLIGLFIFSIYMLIRSFTNPTFAGYLVEDGAPLKEIYFLKLKNNRLVITNAFNKELYNFGINDLFLEIVKEYTPDEVTEENKSVIGRAVVGGLLLGAVGLAPIGAIVGGMSGIGTKQKIKKGNVDTYVHLKTFDKEFLFKPVAGHESTASLLKDKIRSLKKQN